jgi:DNA-binding response OmpR family regulator
VTGNILIVDDDNTVCRSIQEVLAKRGYEVCTADNGAAALSVISRNMPRLIFLAAHMPVMDGLTFLHHYLQLAGAHAPIIVMSAKDDTLSRALALYSHGFLEKPIQREKLLLLIKRYLR